MKSATHDSEQRHEAPASDLSAAPKHNGAADRRFRWGRLLPLPLDVGSLAISTRPSLRVVLLAALHVPVFAGAYWLAYSFRFDFALPPNELLFLLATLPWIVGVKLVVFYATANYHGWWRHVTFAELIALVRASVLSFLILATGGYFISFIHAPRSVLLLDSILTVVVLGALRSSWRTMREHLWPVFHSRDYRLALLVGSDEASGKLAHQIQSQSESSYRICGLLDAYGDGARRYLGRFPILGNVSQTCAIAAKNRVSDVLVTAGILPGKQMRDLMVDCQRIGLNLKIIPPLEERLNGDCRIPIRSIEIKDLLRREPVTLDTEAIHKLLVGKTVMVTGAGGSIGSEICRQVLRFGPKTLVLVGRGENRIFTVDRELRSRPSATDLRVYIGDATDQRRMRQIFEETRPNVIFHAAAHKHVPLMEAHPSEAIKNNVIGTKNMADLAGEYRAESFVLISTDKAVRPVSVMGASKLIAERYVHALSEESATRFVVVRFGNVLGSAGSVVPLFQEQIRRGGPITVTDPRMVRYFMTIPEASQLVIQAAGMGRGGEIFVLEMGEPVKIVDLARDLIRLSGLPVGTIDIAFSGVRPGEKLAEELYFEDEHTLPTSHPKVRTAYHQPCSLPEVREQIESLERLIYSSPEGIRRRLHQLIAEFPPPVAKRRVEKQAAGSGPVEHATS
jgi:FlaA1/EpsC-like NDP-sugar epimerase